MIRTFNPHFCRFILIISLLSTLFFFLSPVFAAETEHITYSARGDNNYPPYEFLNGSGEPDGWNIDLLKAVSEEMGLNITIRLGPWDEVRDDLEQGKIDVLAGMYYSPDRARVVSFSTPHIIVSHAIFVRKGSDIRSPDDIKDKKIIVQKGDIMNDYANSHFPSDNVILVENQSEALNLLSSGKYDCALLAKLQAIYNLNQLKITNLEPVGPPIEPRNYCFAVAPHHEDLLARLNEGLAILKQSGRYDQLYLKWFGVYEENIINSQILTIVQYIIFPAIILILLGFFWSWTLRKQVAIKTAELSFELEERKKIEEALRVNERKYRDVVEDQTELICRFRKDGTIIFANGAFGRFFGKSEDEIIGTRLIPDIPGEDIQELRDHFKSITLDHPVKINEHRIRRPDGGIEWQQWSDRGVFDENGNLIEYQSVGRDITERKQNEEELSRHREHLEELVKSRTEEIIVAKDQADEANQAKSTFLSSMSHELRTPLNAILGYTQILRRQANLTETQKQQLDTVKSSGEHLLTLINDLLDLGKIEAQRMELEESPFNLSAVLRQIFNISKVRAEEKSLYIEYEALAMLPEYVQGDQRKIKQVLLNLLGNAVKYTQSGGIILRVGYVLNEEIFKCEVVDTGIGIPQDKLDIIFEPFRQLPGNTENIEGTGLGLSITQRLVELMHGRLWVESEPGKGSTFFFEVPLPSIEGDRITIQKVEQEITGYLGERKHILIVDDNITNASILVSALEPLGFDLSVTHNTQDEYLQAHEKRPDMIILNLNRPIVSQIVKVEGIHNNPEFKQIKIICISAEVPEKDQIRRLEAVCHGFLSKPIIIDRLLEKIEEQLHLTWEMTDMNWSKPAGNGAESNKETTRIPPVSVLDAMQYAIGRGNFVSLEQMLVSLLEEDPGYSSFCDQVRKYAVRFDDEGVLTYIRTLRSP